MWKKFFYLIIVFCMGLGIWAANLPPNEEPKEDPKKDDCCPGNNNPDCNGCVNYQYLFGRAANEPLMPTGRFSIFTQRPSQNLFSPINLYYYHPLFMQIIKDEVSDSRRIVQIMGPNREAEEYVFQAGESIGYPGTTFRNKLNKTLVMLNANQDPTTDIPIYYRLQNKNGSSILFSASTRKALSYQLITGRKLTCMSKDLRLEAIYNNDGSIRQVFSGTDGLVEVVVVSQEYGYILGYETRVYAPSQVGEKNEEGLYIYTGSPHTVYRIQNPNHPQQISESIVDPDTGEISTRIKIIPPEIREAIITKTSGDVSRVTKYIYNDVVDDWIMESGEGKKIISREKQWNSSKTECTEVMQVKDAQGTVAYQETTLSRNFPFGNMIVEKTIGTGDSAPKTWYTYHTDNSQQGSFGKLASERHSNGLWKKYFYDGQERKTMIVSPFKNQSFDTTQSNAKVEYFIYSPVDPRDIPYKGDARPRVIETKIGGITVSKEYFAYFMDTNGEYVEIHERCSNAVAEYGNASNLRTEKHYYASTADTASQGRIKTVQYPDGKVDSYSYNWGTYTQASEISQSTFSVDDNGLALQTTIIHGTIDNPDGILYKSTKEEKVFDSQGNEVMAKEFVCTANGYEEIFWAFALYNEQNKQIQTINSRNEITQTTWDCCNKQSYTNQYGVQYTYLYDDLQRLIQETKIGQGTQPNITKTFTYDAAGEVLTMSVQAENLSLAEQFEYDLAGRVVKKTMTDGLEISYNYSYATNGSDISYQITETYSDGGQIIRSFYADTQLSGQAGSAVSKQSFDYGITSDGLRWKEIRNGDSNAKRWKRHYYDLAGREVVIESSAPNNAIRTIRNRYNSKGQLVEVATSGLASLLYEYDNWGNLFRQATDTNENGEIDLSGNDLIIEYHNKYMNIDNDWWRIKTSSVYGNEGTDTCRIVESQKTKINNLGAEVISIVKTSDFAGNETTTTEYVDRSNKKRRIVTQSPESIRATETIFVNDLMILQTGITGISYQYSYDALGRVIQLIEPRKGSTTLEYYSAQIGSIGKLKKVTDAAGNSQEIYYDENTGRKASLKNAMGKFMYWNYNSRGQITQVWGAADYPVELIYNDQGKVSAMKTYRSRENWSTALPPFKNLIPDVTKLEYNEYTGLISKKIDPSNRSVTYEYDINGNRIKKTLSRTYEGNPLTIQYYYNNINKIKKISYSDETPEVEYTYNRLGRIQSVDDVVGTRTFEYDTNYQLVKEIITGLYNLTIERSYSTEGLLGRYQGIVGHAQYSYNNLGQIDKVITAYGNLTYNRLEESSLLASLSRPNQVDTFWQYEEHRDLLTQIKHANNSSVLAKYSYSNDALGRLSNVQKENQWSQTPEYFTFQYNDRGEITQGNSNLDPSYNYLFSYDDIGNRITSQNGNLLSAYTNNQLNQYLSISTNSQTTSFLYDEDGNMNSWNGWQLSWDCENRLIKMEKGDTRLEFAYDYLSRRVYKKKFVGNILESHINFVYDGRTIIKELDGRLNNVLLRENIWQPEIFNQQLPLLTHIPADDKTYYYHHDRNKNVTEITDNDGNIAAQYSYSPYGLIIKSSGNFAADNYFRFSSEYHDTETGLVAYCFRYYDPQLGRWLNRDPLEEGGGVALYNFCHNAPTYVTDNWGLTCNTFSRSFEVGAPPIPLPVPPPLFGSTGFSASVSLSIEACDNCCEDGNTKTLLKYSGSVSGGSSITLGGGINKSIDIPGEKSLSAKLFAGIKITGAGNFSFGASWEEGGCEDKSFDDKICVGADASLTVTGGAELSLELSWWSWTLGATINGSGSISCEVCFTFGNGGISFAGFNCSDGFEITVYTQVCVGTCWQFEIYSNQ